MPAHTVFPLPPHSCKPTTPALRRGPGRYDDVHFPLEGPEMPLSRQSTSQTSAKYLGQARRGFEAPATIQNVIVRCPGVPYLWAPQCCHFGSLYKPLLLAPLKSTVLTISPFIASNFLSPSYSSKSPIILAIHHLHGNPTYNLESTTLL